jgi:hypothetical protein
MGDMLIDSTTTKEFVMGFELHKLAEHLNHNKDFRDRFEADPKSALEEIGLIIDDASSRLIKDSMAVSSPVRRERVVEA